MKMNMKKENKLNLNYMKSMLQLPAPSNISLLWNMGSLSGICLMIQIISGILLALRYCPDHLMAFNSVAIICRETYMGWMLRTIHSNGASLFFIFLYLHIGRGLYYQSYKFVETWSIGVMLFLMTMGTAFLGYVLPWGQMSFWGASVITNLLTVIPYVGKMLAFWLWGAQAVGAPTLNRFFGLHFVLPFVILTLVLLHLIFLHKTGSNNPMGLPSNLYKIPFHPYFMFKDIMGFSLLMIMMMILIFYYPNLLSDPDNFIPANSMVTPVHIQPEWYFLFAYAILRSIPNKMGGVLALLMSIMILLIMPMNNYTKFQGNNHYYFNKILFWLFINSIILLTWIGMRPVEIPYILLGQFLTLFYFSYYILTPMLYYYWDKWMK